MFDRLRQVLHTVGCLPDWYRCYVQLDVCHTDAGVLYSLVFDRLRQVCLTDWCSVFDRLRQTLCTVWC